MELEAAKMIGAGIAVLGVIGAAMGVGRVNLLRGIPLQKMICKRSRLSVRLLPKGLEFFPLLFPS